MAEIKTDNGMYLHEDITRKVIGAAMRVHQSLGCGFLEKVYQEALAIELEENGVAFEREKSFPLYYRGRELACKYIADFLVEGKVIVELKATDALDDKFKGQVINYLRASNLRVGLLINFGEPHLTCKRLIL